MGGWEGSLLGKQMAETRRGVMIILAETNKQKVERDGGRERTRARTHTYKLIHVSAVISNFAV